MDKAVTIAFAIYLTWAAKYLQFSKAKTQENFFKNCMNL